MEAAPSVVLMVIFPYLPADLPLPGRLFPFPWLAFGTLRGIISEGGGFRLFGEEGDRLITLAHQKRSCFRRDLFFFVTFAI